MTDAIYYMKTIAKNVDLNDEKEILQIARSTIATKFTNKWGDLICKLAICV
jgi:chaperonin GroEL (HSP60 family)